ncbi:lebercilin [Aplochiton taeniatus]
MDSEKALDPYEDNRETDRSRRSLRSTGKDSQVSFVTSKRDESKDVEDKDISAGDRARTRTRDPDPDRDRMSDEERRRSSRSFYSEDYDNVSPSERSLSPSSRSPTPSPSPRKGASGSPFYKKGALPGGVRRGAPRPHRQQQRPGVRSHSKDSTAPPKDLDMVTKRMLSARLLKINELRNALTELQQRTDQLQKENRVLRQLQLRQEKALQRYDDTESEIAQLLSRHANETQSLRERLRRAQERERAAERRLKDGQEQLQRSQATLGRLRKLADQQELGPREELRCRLEQESARAQEGEHRIKELERSIELSSGSFQRQLAGERRKTISAQEEVKALQEEMERLNNKLKEKERELDTRNIYANRMLKPSPRKDTNPSIKHKVLSGISTKAVQTESRVLSLDFPSPPPAITLGSEDDQQAPGDYLSLKREQSRERRNQVEEEVERRNQDALVVQRAAGEEQQRKAQLLAKLHEIDRQRDPPRDAMFSEALQPNGGPSGQPPPCFTEPTDQSSSLFSFTEPEPAGGLRLGAGSRDGARRSGGLEGGLGTGRRGMRTQISSEDLAFGSYAPSFGRPAARGTPGFPPPPALEDSLGSGMGLGPSDRGPGKERKSSLMQQLFGAPATPPASSTATSTMEVLRSPPVANGGRSQREGLFSFDPEHLTYSTPSVPTLSTLHVAQSKPTVRAMASFDDDVEELTL